MLDSIVTTVDLYDLVVVKKRKDKLVSVMMTGLDSDRIDFCDNNAKKAAEAFVARYDTCGADITVYRNIPTGLGMGSSSADAAGVINGLASLYRVNDPIGIKMIADGVGSDTRYMLSGGYARLFGRGDEVKPVESKLKLNFLLLAPKGRVNTAECFKSFDRLGTIGGDSELAERALADGDRQALAKCVHNSLTAPAEALCPDVRTAVEELSAFDPMAVGMTGSGSGVFALFENPEFCTYAKSRYAGKFRPYILKTRL